MAFDFLKKKQEKQNGSIASEDGQSTKQLGNLSLDELGDIMVYQFYQNGEPIRLSGEDEKFIHTSIDTLREFFKENHIAFDVSTQGTEAKILHFGMSIQGEPTDVLIAIFLKPKMCSIVFKLPFKANVTMEAELYSALMKYNCTRRFGSFIYDKNDGEIDYKTDFPCADGVKKEDFVAAFIISMNSISKFMEELKRYVVPK